MGFGGVSIWSLLIILVIVIVLFGSKRIKEAGGDLGGFIGGFKKAMKPDKPGKPKVPAKTKPNPWDEKNDTDKA